MSLCHSSKPQGVLLHFSFISSIKRSMLHLVQILHNGHKGDPWLAVWQNEGENLHLTAHSLTICCTDQPIQAQ